MGTIDGERFAWPLYSLGATPYDSRVMEMHLDGSLLYFVADDPLPFADELTETLERTSPTSEMTERLRRQTARPPDPLDRRTIIPCSPP